MVELFGDGWLNIKCAKLSVNIANLRSLATSSGDYDDR